MFRKNINLTQIFHIETLAQEGLDLIDQVKTCFKDQYAIDIQAQYNSLTPIMAVLHTLINLIDTKTY
jgi:hypothetical protein